MSQSRVSIVLNEASLRNVDRPGVNDAQLSDENIALNQEIARLRLRVIELEHAADTDPLIPVYNRRAFIREVKRAQTVKSRYNMVSSLIFFDLNGFKAINDCFGHAVGDALLQKVGESLTNAVRDCDMVARLGGDEFGVLLFKSTPDVARAKAAALACHIAAQTIETPQGEVSVSTAWGVAACDSDFTTEEILDRADREMYLSKRQQKSD